MKQIEQTLTSLEVAEMVEKEHKNLLRDIKRYCKQMKQANDDLADDRVGLKIEPVDFFIESTYIDGKGEERPCYKVTKKGCEFIAHKTTGTKGTAFTARYINRFHSIEQAIQQIAENQKQAEQLKIQEHSNTYLLPVADSWFNEMNDIFERVCAFYNWKRSRLYHEILNELSERYDIQKAIETYKIEKGEEPKYIMDVVEWFPQLRNETVKIMKRYESVGNV